MLRHPCDSCFASADTATPRRSSVPFQIPHSPQERQGAGLAIVLRQRRHGGTSYIRILRFQHPFPQERQSVGILAIGSASADTAALRTVAASSFCTARSRRSSIVFSIFTKILRKYPSRRSTHNSLLIVDQTIAKNGQGFFIIEKEYLVISRITEFRTKPRPPIIIKNTSCNHAAGLLIFSIKSRQYTYTVTLHEFIIILTQCMIMKK